MIRLRNVLVALGFAVAGMTTTVAPAAAESVRFGVTIGDGGPRYDQGPRHDRGPRYDRGPRHERPHYRPRPDYGCSPREATRKASRMGLRRAYVTDVGRRSITVEGRSRGDHAVARFAKARGCPVISFRN